MNNDDIRQAVLDTFTQQLRRKHAHIVEIVGDVIQSNLDTATEDFIIVFEMEIVNYLCSTLAATKRNIPGVKFDDLLEHIQKTIRDYDYEG